MDKSLYPAVEELRTSIQLFGHQALEILKTKTFGGYWPAHSTSRARFTLYEALDTFAVY